MRKMRIIRIFLGPPSEEKHEFCEKSELFVYMRKMREIRIIRLTKMRIFLRAPREGIWLATRVLRKLRIIRLNAQNAKEIRIIRLTN